MKSIGMLNGVLSVKDPLMRARLLITFSHFLLFVLSGLPRQHGVRAALTPPIDAFFSALVSLSYMWWQILNKVQFARCLLA